MEFNRLLYLLNHKKASDLFITVDSAPTAKIHGKMVAVTDERLSYESIEKIMQDIMDERQLQQFYEQHECNFAISYKQLGRFRVSAFWQLNNPGMVIRRIENKVPTVEELELPEVIKKIALEKNGLVLFIGATGTGKSTSLAAMLGYINYNRTGHIISIEDPIEYVHQHHGCIVTQREVGVDTESFDMALRNSLRQAPDVILVGEIRTRETMRTAMTLSETGHLCLATLHANTASQALERVVNFFPSDQHAQLWMDLSINMRAVVAQQLLPRCDKPGRTIAVEILINTPFVADLVKKGEIFNLSEIMSRGADYGMQTFDQALFRLYAEGKISYETAMIHAVSQNNLRLMIKLRDDKVATPSPKAGDSDVDNLNSISLQDD